MGKSKKTESVSKKTAKTSTSLKENERVKVKEKVVAASKEIDTLFTSAPKKALKNESNDVSFSPEVLKSRKYSDVSKHKADGLEASYGIMKSNLSNEIVNPEAPLERIDAESGLPVYKAHLLKVGEGGGTPLCPFDCNCCF